MKSQFKSNNQFSRVGKTFPKPKPQSVVSNTMIVEKQITAPISKSE